ncbi:MFS transporter [Actinoplanes italicus]|uniref:Putative MFS family arabinose efflux permease n=1 Tax=Actinoplanes italicus TaxID=113567 RepID=A0A2T0JZH8_9ACTN|nr:MFS transporter [Actinoplanes italicus]PRX14736.1 putative MFS family arabinose efflux permease [Actinoplanes italicus]GIE34602.1 MFS transporter [Actinoplanes italicus]
MDPVRRGRVATSLVFLLFGTALGVWTARIPAVKENLGLSDGRLSLALLAFAAGCITGMALIGRLTDRFGSSRVLVPAALLEGVLLIPPALAGGLTALCAALFVFGAVHGTLNIAMNANAAELERAHGRPIMTSFHAIYSIGGFLGAIVGSLFAHSGLSVASTLISVGLTALALAAWASRWVLRSEIPADAMTASDAAGAGRHRPLLIFFGIVVLGTLVGEGAAADWSAVYLRDDLGTSEGFAAYGYAAFAILMTAGRLVGDRFVARFGPVTLIRASGVLAAAGLGAGLLIEHPAAGVAGFGLLGLGVSCVAPQFFSAAAGVDPRRAGQALSTVVSIGYVGFLLGPIAIGAAATAVGLPTALWIPVALAVFVALSAGSIRRTTGPAGDRSTRERPAPAT